MSLLVSSSRLGWHSDEELAELDVERVGTILLPEKSFWVTDLWILNGLEKLFSR